MANSFGVVSHPNFLSRSPDLIGGVHRRPSRSTPMRRLEVPVRCRARGVARGTTRRSAIETSSQEFAGFKLVPEYNELFGGALRSYIL